MNQNKFLKSAQAMQSLSMEDKIDQFNFSPDRADVIDHAIAIFVFMMQKTGCKKIKSTKWGVSDSIAVKLFHEIYSKKIKLDAMSRYFKLDISKFTAGNYILKIHAKSGFETIKFIKR